MESKINCVVAIDDDAICNFITKGVLKNTNCTERIECFSNASEALRFIDHYATTNNYCPELIVLDINMPGMDGFEFLEQLRKKDYPNIDNVVVVGLSAVPLHESDKSQSFDEMFVKPFKKEQVYYIFEKYFSKIQKEFA